MRTILRMHHSYGKRKALDDIGENQCLNDKDAEVGRGQGSPLP
jgi:hypothetical protein